MIPASGQYKNHWYGNPDGSLDVHKGKAEIRNRTHDEAANPACPIASLGFVAMQNAPHAK
ncbi:hypothetical protein SDC9_61765 [bioreactor metagenome]|uniref:Uncharacterized protein n=1 Tax=bioreactor metagenome TaxID=1076179 RepID=A0A644XGP8_9ZZZZ